MRVALLHPTYWPEVRRGSERLVHDLATTLAGRGHDVTLLTSHPFAGATEREDGFRVVRSRRLPQPPTFGLHEHFLGNLPTLIWHLARGRYDVAHGFHLAYAWAGVQARHVGGPPVVFSFHGMPTRSELVARRYRLEMMQATIAGSAASAVLSEAAAKLFRRYLMTEPRLLPGGVLTETFSGAAARADVPTVLCAASVGDPRKRGELLMSAFQELRERRPDARLVVVRTPDPHLSPRAPSLPEGAEWIEPRTTGALARAYAEAWTSVLTSIDEPFGLVLVESLAAGTPVVATRSGSCPEIVVDRSLGRLFDPDDRAGLVDALDAGLRAPPDERTVAACRRRAGEYDWSRVVELYESLYEEVVRTPAGRRG